MKVFPQHGLQNLNPRGSGRPEAIGQLGERDFQVTELELLPALLRIAPRPYSFSKPWLVNFSDRLFSVTVRTTCSGAPEGISASKSQRHRHLGAKVASEVGDGFVGDAAGVAADLGGIQDYRSVEALWLRGRGRSTQGRGGSGLCGSSDHPFGSGSTEGRSRKRGRAVGFDLPPGDLRLDQ